MELAETLLRRLGGVLAYGTLVVLFYGIWRGVNRPGGRISGKAASWLRSLPFYGLASACFLGISIFFWKPMPVYLPQGVRLALLALGSVLYFPAMALILWGRLALGEMYFVSTSFGAQLYGDHRLVTHGPYALVRHPMYLGLAAAALGSLLLYHTWTTLGFAIFAPFVLLRASREEMVLATEFGEQWREYCKQVPAFLPRPWKKDYHSLQGANMPEKTSPILKGISETLLITLYTRAKETQRPDAMIRDEKAVEIVNQLKGSLSRFKLQGHDEVALILRVRQFDRMASRFLAANPEAVVVHFGCGLDTRFERVDDGRVQWFDLDLPEVVELRKKLIGGDDGHYHLISGSVFEDTWLEAVSPYAGRAFLFIAEGVLPYFEEAQVKSLFMKIRDRFPGAEIVCDAHTPFVIQTDNLQLALLGVNARLHWGLKQGKDVEKWGEGISMLEEWFYFDDPAPRMAAYRWMRLFPLLGKSTGIFHYRLGGRS